MASRTCILLAILGFTAVHMGALFRGQSVSEVWLTALVVMVVSAVVGFFLGWAYESLLKEVLVQEESVMLSDYLEKNPGAHGPHTEAEIAEDIPVDSDVEGDESSGLEIPGGPQTGAPGS